MTTGVVALIFLAVILVFLGRYSCNFSRRRPPKEMDELYRDFDCANLVAFEDFKQIMELAGKCYAMDPKKFLPNDTFEALSKMGTWMMGAEDDLVEYARQKGVEDEAIQSVKTLKDYVVLVGVSRMH